VQVVCGQQHTICRAVDFSTPTNSTFKKTSTKHSVFVGSNVGADCYTWGNGVLGQLGHGRKGTSKGRLVPTLVEKISQLHPKGIVSVGAGANFSVVVTDLGSVYSFGHVEYNQHGTGNESNNDYTDPYYYFEPRMVNISSTTTTTNQQHNDELNRPHMVSVSCGAVFTIGMDDAGNLFSWGWNESGVLGHGFNHFAAAALRLTNIGSNFDGCSVKQFVTGSKHVIALVESHSNTWASNFRSLMLNPTYADCFVHIDAASSSSSSIVSFPCHKAVLSARSNYFRGYLKAAALDQEEERLIATLQNNEYSDKFSINEALVSSSIIHVNLTSKYANSVSMKYLLEYIYLDIVQIPVHKRNEVINLSKDLGMKRLEKILQSIHNNNNSNHNDGNEKKLDNDMNGEGEKKKQYV
jgi:hypothetical protein